MNRSDIIPAIKVNSEKQANQSHICNISIKEQFKITLDFNSNLKKDYKKNNWGCVWKKALQNDCLLRTKICSNLSCAFIGFKNSVRIVLNLLLLNGFNKVKIQAYETKSKNSDTLKKLLIQQVSPRFIGKLYIYKFHVLKKYKCSNVIFFRQ